jgi:tryptophan synthase alpha chain
LKKLVAYITSSYPSNSFSIDLALSLKDAGVDILELGVPFSDPVADGSVIEKANLLALQNGFKLDDLFRVSKEIAPHVETLWMGYANPFYHKGFEWFLQKAKEYQVEGMIIPDIPYEESLSISSLFEQFQKSLVTFVAPTTPEDRVKKLVENSQKFIYLVAYAGITGSGKEEDLSSLINNIREYSKTPIYIGFGVNEDNAKEKVKGLDGVIVGSRFVKVLLDNTLSSSEKISRISQKARVIKDKINS